jgi:6-phosphogluconolactonase
MEPIQIYSDQADQSQAAISLFIKLAQKALLDRGSFSVALSGGSTPRQVYAGLANVEHQDQLDWRVIHLFFGDERHVPANHRESNFRMVQETLLNKVPLLDENIHRVKTELDPRLAAFEYEEALRAFFNGAWPRFDLVFLGMGTDGHTASLFPNTAGLNEEQRWFIANWVPSQDAWRLTLTKNAINAARNIVVLVSGSSKAQMLSQVLTGEYDPYHKPIQLIQPVDGEMIWLIDQEAAMGLNE